MNPVHYNLLSVSNGVTIDHDITPNLQGDYRFGQGGAQIYTFSVSSTYRVRWADGLVQNFTSTQVPGYNMRSLPNGNRQTVSIDFISPDTVTAINYYSCRLHSVPEELRKFKNLTTLQLQNNLLTSGFPPVIMQLQKLTTLLLNGSNNLAVLPAEVLLIPTLTVLHIGSESFSTLPDVFDQSNIRQLLLNVKAYTMPNSLVNSKVSHIILNTSQVLPANFASWAALKKVQLGRLSDGTGVYMNAGLMPSICANGVHKLSDAFTNHTGIEWLEMITVQYFYKLEGLEKMTGLKTLILGTNTNTTTNNTISQNIGSGALPAGFQNLTKLKDIRFYAMNLNQLTVINTLIDSFYAIASNYAPITGTSADAWRNVGLILAAYNIGVVATPSGTYQQPAGYVQGSSNGIPASQKEKIWVLVNQYSWAVTVP